MKLSSIGITKINVLYVNSACRTNLKKTKFYYGFFQFQKSISIFMESISEKTAAHPGISLIPGSLGQGYIMQRKSYNVKNEWHISSVKINELFIGFNNNVLELKGLTCQS